MIRLLKKKKNRMQKKKDIRTREINHGQSLAGFDCELSVKLEHSVPPFVHPLFLSLSLSLSFHER